MTREEITSKVIDIIKNCLENKNITITTSSLLVEDLSLDSFAAIMILNDLEDEFHLTVGDDAFDGFKNVDNIVSLIQNMLNEKEKAG
ncbi:MAG: acyl carrier protein [Oligoflexia bacterium]|nr:acyl carrier protein [Oligoflexia bacterium]